MQLAIPGQANKMWLPLAKTDGNPITSGTVNFYLVRLSTGKWWNGSGSSWSDTEAVAGAATHKSKGHWELSIATGAWNQNERYKLYGQESGDLNIVVEDEVICRTIADTWLGQGTIAVDHNYGGADNLAYKTAGGAGIDNASIWAYLKSDYDAGNMTAAYVKGRTTTDVNGQWTNPMNLDPGAYTLYYYKQGAYGPDTKEVTVS